MGWKKWPYWLRGGIVGLVAFAGLLVVASVLDIKEGGSPPATGLVLIPGVVGAYMLYPSVEAIDHLATIRTVSGIFYFVVGAFVGSLTKWVRARTSR